MKKTIFILFLFFCICNTNAQLVLSTDFTNSTNKKEVLKNIWNVANRISPTNGSGVKPGLEVNTIRMIGGINKKVNGVDVPNLEFDPVSYDASTGNYVYNWSVLKSRINAIRNEGIKIHQIVLDQVPWAFQQGYTFIPAGTTDNVNFREDEKLTIYGNSLPPKDKVAYFNFIKALMTELVATYGQAEVLSWRFRVGSEIETPEHWLGTEQDFIDHFANTVNAVRAVLPNAVIGLHTREPSFLYRSGTVLNYKSEKIKSFATGLINYCYANNIKYDFWGISDYVLIGGASDRDISQKYATVFAPLINNSKWNANATIDLMEYAIVTTMGGADGLGYINCATPHAELINVAFSNLFYKNEFKGLQYIFRWGQRPGTIDPPSIEILKTMEGKNRFQTSISGTATTTTNQLDAIFSQNAVGDEVDVLAYNLSANSLSYLADESVSVSFKINLPAGTVLKYRSLAYGKDQNSLENFFKNEPTSGWVKSGFDKKGDPSRTLNTAGAAAWASFTNPNPPVFTDWGYVTTVARTDGGTGSEVNVSTSLPSFAFKKFEFRPLDVAPTQQPYKGTPSVVPGIIEMEDFDEGLEGQSYHDTDTAGGGGYRISGVDIGTVSPSGYCISNVLPGEWVEYTVDVAENANYDVVISYASKLTTGVIGAELFDESKMLFNDFALPQTSTTVWTTYVTATKKEVYLTKGVHVLRINVVARGFNLDKMEFKKSENQPLGTESFGKDSKIIVYPNPNTTGYYNLDESSVWKVYSVGGSIVKSGQGIIVDISSLSKGIYILKTPKGTQKIIFE